MTEKVLIATYGSLRRGMSNFRVNERGGGVYKFTGKTKDMCNLYEYGGGSFPSLSLAHNWLGTQVVVDVFETTQRGLEGAYDALEGHRGKDAANNFYDRSQVVILDDEGNEHLCWIYHIDEEQEVFVDYGDWCIHKDPKYYDQFKEDKK